MKQKNYVAGLYLRLSQEDERQGESVSIENQRTILRKYALEHGFTIHDEYIDDGISGTTFNRQGVQRLLDDAKNGIINTIIVKDMSRFGRNYIEVGQYTDYVFPTFGIRFIAIQDNVDTENKNSNSMEMLPIVNVFNEWHAANTSKKIRAVRQEKAKEGVYITKKAAYGYKLGEDKKRTPVIDEYAAGVVRRIFEMYALGITPRKICATLIKEGVQSPAVYAYTQKGLKPSPNIMGFWSPVTIREMLQNIIYLGHLPQLCVSTISYKNHKRYKKDKSDWTIVYNNHEPIISQELWDKVQARKKSISHGKKTKLGFTHPLSGFLVCADCGSKMKLCTSHRKNSTKYRLYFDCGYNIRYGKLACFSHYISAKVLAEIVLEDIREMAKKITIDEEEIKKEFIKHNSELADATIKKTRKDLQVNQRRLEELSKLIQTSYEDKVMGRIPEDVCIEFIEKYSAEKKTLAEEIKALEANLVETENTKQSADDFIKAFKKYIDAPELTREMCFELIERIIIGGTPSVTGKDREIDIVYKVDLASVMRDKLKRIAPVGQKHYTQY